MSDKLTVTEQFQLEYWAERDRSGTMHCSAPVDPEHTDELLIAVRADDDEDADPRARVLVNRPQIHFAGSPRALEAFGLYLIALARLDSANPNVHDHFEDVQNDDGGTLHLIVRRFAR